MARIPTVQMLYGVEDTATGLVYTVWQPCIYFTETGWSVPTLVARTLPDP